ncbi:MAG: DUF6443 domain-containing protein, partial [Bacteroidota bacterium]
QNITTYDYLDDIGRPIQSVKQIFSDDSLDVVTATEYDDYGRMAKVYEPFAFNQKNGHFVPQTQWPSSTLTDFTATTYEESPLNRQLAVKAPDWDYEKTFEYGTNASSFTIGTITYPAKSLVVNTVVDPNNNKAITFTDLKGRLLLSRRTDALETVSNDTYHHYDDKDRLTKIVPPGASENSNGLNYFYHYDDRDNIIQKKIPDMGDQYFWYDNRELLTYTQDPNMLAQGRALRTAYDVYGRTTTTGFTAVPTDGDDLLSYNDTLTISTYYGGAENQGQRYQLQQARTRILDGSENYLITNYTYDLHGRIVNSTGNNHLNLNIGSMTMNYTYDFADNVVTENSTQTTIAGESVTQVHNNHFDHSGRLVAKYHKIGAHAEELICSIDYTEKDQIEHKYLGGTDIQNLQTVAYSYNAQRWLTNLSSPLFSLTLRYKDPIQNANTAYKNGNITEQEWTTPTTGTMRYRYMYDYLDRITSASYTIGPGDYYSSYQYDARGNITDLYRKGRYTDGNGVQQDDVIDFLGYDYELGTNQLINIDENITDQYARKEGFDPSQYTTGTYQYDANGNLENDPYKKVAIDYNYLNQPTNVTHSTEGTIVWLYDAAGTRLRKTVITFGNTESISGVIPSGDYYGTSPSVDGQVLPGSTVNVFGEQSVNLLPGFQAQSGSSFLAAIGTGTGNVSTTRDYITGVEYLNGNLEEIMHAEGRVTFPDGTNPQYEYVLKDHLGNSRIVFADLNNDGNIITAEILQENHYYAFGLQMNGTWQNNPSQPHRYTYNGKEEQLELGLGWLSYGAREYDASIARFIGVDPIAEEFAWVSTFNYAENEPVGHIDLWGLQKAKSEESKGNVTFKSGSGGAAISAYNSQLRINYANEVSKLKPWYSIDKLTAQHSYGVLKRTELKENTRASMVGGRAHLDKANPVKAKFTGTKSVVVEGYYGIEEQKPNPRFYEANKKMTTFAKYSRVAGAAGVVLDFCSF